MTFGSRARRPAPGPVLSTILVVALAGCSGSPLLRARRELPATPTPTQSVAPAALELPAPAEGVAADDLPRMPPLPSRSTPMLDAALVRAESMHRETLAEFEQPQPAPVVLPPGEPTPPVNVVEPEPTPAPAPAPPPAGPKSDPAVKPASAVAPAPGDPWREGLESLREYARERAGEGEGPWTIRGQLLEWVGGPDQAQVDTGALWQAILAVLEARGRDDEEPAERGEKIREAVRALEDLAPLEITELEACRKVHGFGDYEPFDGDGFRPGQSLILYCELAGLRYEPADGQYRSRLASHVELVPEGSGQAAWSQALGTADDRCRRRRRDYYVNYLFALPADLEPGRYELRLTQSDLVAGRSTARAFAVTIRP